MLRSNSFVKFLAALALTALGALSLSSQGIITPPSLNEFGMIGIAQGQTLRLSVVAYPPNPIFPPNPICVAQLGFANSSGGVVGPTKTVNLSPGQGDFLDLNGNTLVRQFGQRAEVHPVVTLEPSATGGTSACQATSEIFDNFTGFSLLLAPGAAVTVAPGPSNFGLLGLARGQVMRLNILASGGGCVAQLSFADSFGQIAPGPTQKTVNLSAGQADFLDIAGASLVSQFGQRTELRPVVTVPAGAVGGTCAATVEVYDVFTGRTWAWYPPTPI